MNELERVLRDQCEELENTDFGSLVTRKEEEQLELDSTVAHSLIIGCHHQ